MICNDNDFYNNTNENMKWKHNNKRLQNHIYFYKRISDWIQLLLEIKVYNLCIYTDSCGYYLYDNIILLSIKYILFKYIYIYS